MKLATANKINRLWNNGVLAKMVAKTKVLKTLEEVAASTNEENVMGAPAGKELINKLAHGRVELVVNEDGTLGYKLDGADTVIPFSNGTYRLTLGGTLSLHNSSAGYAYNTGINVYADVTIKGNKISYTGFSASDLSTRSGQLNAMGVDWGYNTQLSAKIRGLGIASIAKI